MIIIILSHKMTDVNTVINSDKNASLWPDFNNNFGDYVTDPKWKKIIASKKQLLDKLLTFIEADYKKYNGYFKILPAKHLVMNSMTQTDFDKVTVVILGQDPFPNPTFPIGMSFSVNQGVEIPKSLANIFRECHSDKENNFEIPNHGDLTTWAQQGVLLLNNTLTVLEGSSNSHACFEDENKKKYYWKDFTDHIIKSISHENENVVFMLWGKSAQVKEKLIDSKKHLILKCAHPSPLSANKGGWYGCKHFSKAN